MRKKENFLYSLAASERERGRERERKTAWSCGGEILELIMYECFCVENYPAIISSRCHGPVYVKVSRKQYYNASRLYSSMEAMVTQA